MKTLKLLNYERDRWIGGDGNLSEIPSAIDGAPVALTGSGGLDFGGMLRHAREVGGPALRKMTFHERARMIKALGLAIMARKEELYELSYQTGATRRDGWIGVTTVRDAGVSGDCWICLTLRLCFIVVSSADNRQNRDVVIAADRSLQNGVEQLALERGEEALAQGVVVAVADRAHRRPHPGLPASLAEGDGGVLGALVGVMDHVGRPALPQRRWVAIAQPTTRRLQASITTARNRKPDQVGMYVMSATHS